MEPLKEMFNEGWYKNLGSRLAEVDADFNSKKFVSGCCKNISELSLNQRLRRTSQVLRELLPASYARSVKILREVIPQMPGGYTNLVFPDFVSLYGHSHFNLSMDSLAYFTRFGSSEFAVREFLKNDFDNTIKVMYSWANDENHHVRRLASEGSRPRLPWSFKLDRVIQQPESTRPILDALRADPELYVRKSVANHLNDISKFDPAYMLRLCASWPATNERTAWIIRHANRTLIKKGHEGSLAALRFEKDPLFEVKKFRLSPPVLKIGSTLSFSFEMKGLKDHGQKLAVDFKIYYQKKNGVSAKTFKLKEFVLMPGVDEKLAKKQSFTDLSTRKHRPGRHLFELQVNGRTIIKEAFTLLA